MFFDKAYVDFDLLHHLHQRGVTWVTRAKENICYEVMGQQLSEEEIQQAKYMRKNNNFMGQQPIVLSDCRIGMRANYLEKYPQELRLVSACVLINGRTCAMNFITNNFYWSAYSICDLYLARWGIEVFFKEIKQTLQLADFLGTSENAIKWQIWTALLAYLPLRLIGWLAEWKQSFRRLYTLVKGMLWSRRNISELLKLALLPADNKPPPPCNESNFCLTLDDNSAQKQKSDKTTFSKIKFLPFKYGENTRFLKNYGISVGKLRKKQKKSGKNLHFAQKSLY